MATPIPDNAAAFDLDEIAAATGGTVRRAAPPTRGVVIDSRRARDNRLFVAIEGDTYDGHRFVDAAARAGAGAVLVRRGTDVPARVGCVEVDDTLHALGELARLHRRRWGGQVVGVTGSAGKTTTKELIAAALEAAVGGVHRTAGNLNNRIGLPMTVLELDARVGTAVLEMGTSEVGEIARLAEIAAPDVGVVTMASAAHTEGLGGVEGVADEKASLLWALGEGGVAITLADDARLMARLPRSPARVQRTFGRADGAHVRLLGFEVGRDLRTRCRLSVDGDDVTLSLRLLGEAAALNAAAALAVTTSRPWGGAGELERRAARARVVAALEAVEPPPGRMRPVAGVGVLVLDDSYNANPRSMAIALATARAVADARGARLVVALGDMKELGDPEAAHAEVGRAAATAGVDLLVGCGELMRLASRAAEADGVRCLTADSSAEAAALVRAQTREGDVVLVKGSRSMAMERVVDALAHPGEAA